MSDTYIKTSARTDDGWVEIWWGTKGCTRKWARRMIDQDAFWAHTQKRCAERAPNAGEFSIHVDGDPSITAPSLGALREKWIAAHG